MNPVARKERLTVSFAMAAFAGLIIAACVGVSIVGMWTGDIPVGMGLVLTMTALLIAVATRGIQKSETYSHYGAESSKVDSRADAAALRRIS